MHISVSAWGYNYLFVCGLLNVFDLYEAGLPHGLFNIRFGSSDGPRDVHDAKMGRKTMLFFASGCSCLGAAWRIAR